MRSSYPLQRCDATSGGFAPQNPHTNAFPFCRSTGYSSRGLGNARMDGLISGYRAPFTLSQWMELEHQALMYRYIMANMPIPSYLLNPFKNALDSSGFSGFSGLRPNALGRGAFHLGFSRSTDPEPGRCRRTDGKKWRCARDAVADQKYCERHMNRGRHRSRKPVESQPGHSAFRATTTNGKSTQISSSMALSVEPPPGSSTKSLSLSGGHGLGSLPGSTDPLLGLTSTNLSFPRKESADGVYQRTTVLSTTSPKLSLNHHGAAIRQPNSRQDSTYPDFESGGQGHFLSPLNTNSTLVCSKSYSTSNKLDDSDNVPHRVLGQLMDDSHRTAGSTISWPNRTSISVPTLDFMSSTSSPAHQSANTSPLRLSRDFKATTEMALGVQNVPWESTMGGPLAEVLHKSNSTGKCKNDSKSLNLTDNWLDNSSHLASSPAVVLRDSFEENSKGRDGASFWNAVIGPSLTLPSLPAL